MRVPCEVQYDMGEAVLSANLTVFDGESLGVCFGTRTTFTAQKGSRLTFLPTTTGSILVTFGGEATTFGTLGRVLFSF